MFVIGDFVKEVPEYQSKYVTRLYDQGKQFHEALADLRMYQQTGQIEKAIEYQQEHPTEIRLGKLYQNAERLLGKVNSQIRNVQARDIEGEEKRQRLDQLYEVRNRIAKTIEERSREIQEQAQ
jgi:hypothetical protein